MDKRVNKNTSGLRGAIEIPADKSISHRAIMLCGLADGRSTIKNFSKGADCISTLNILNHLGVKNEFRQDNLVITSTGGLTSPRAALNCGNSGTTMRIMSGILAGQGFESTLCGDASLSSRPMRRVVEPLTKMGARISATGGCAPLTISGSELAGITWVSELASAQVKSCVLLAGLFASGETRYEEPYPSRNHTELMLAHMGANITCSKGVTTIQKGGLIPQTIEIGGDISSAAYFIVAALIIPNSDIILKNVGLNPTRTGILDVLGLMGADIKILDKRVISNEDVGDIRIKTSKLVGCTIDGALIPRLIDELPILAVLASQAAGETVVKDAQELRNKESDRIRSIVAELKKLGADIREEEDGFVVDGTPVLLGGAEVDSHYDHRLAMSLYIAGLVCKSPIVIHGFEWVNISFPEFERLVSSLSCE